MSGTSIAVLAGGVGAARLLRGLVAVTDPRTVAAVVNTGDDFELHGLAISPDLDTVVYTLADAIDPDRGWGLAGESWRAMEAIDRYATVRPADSAAATTWFNLGDRDLATHMYRTARLGEGATLTDVTAEIAAAWGIAAAVLPMTDHRFRTHVTLAESGESVPFQEYFVQRRHGVAIGGVTFDQAGATLSASAERALIDAGTLVIAPSNPFVSIGPLRALPGVDELLARRRDQVVAVSPIVGGAAIKGPADRMMVELGGESSVVGIARLYRDIAGTLVIDDVDGDARSAIEALGMRCVVTDTVMATPPRAQSLARACLAAV